MYSGSIGDYVIQQLEQDDRYKQALSGSQDAEKIDGMIKDFVVEMAKSFDDLLRQLDDPAIRAEFEKRRGR